MKFLIIGHKYPNSYILNLGGSLIKKGHKVEVLGEMELAKHFKPQEVKDFLDLGKKISLSIIEDIYEPDIIFIEHCFLMFENDAFCPVWFNHREIFFQPSVIRPDVYSYANPETMRLYRTFYKWDYINTPKKIRLLPGVEPDLFPPVPEVKDIKGLVDIDIYDTHEMFNYDVNCLYDQIRKSQLEIQEYVEENNLVTSFLGRISQEEYNDILTRSEAILIFPAENVYIGRRILEAALQKTLIVLHVQNDNAMEYYNSIGLLDGVNCFLYRNKEDLTCFESGEPIPLNHYKIIKNAQDWVLENYTYDILADKILKIIEDEFIEK